MATTKFIEAGTAATQGFEFFTSTSSGSTGTITSDAQALAGSGRSIKASSGSGNGWGQCWIDGAINDLGSRISFYFRFTGTISASGNGADFLMVGPTSNISFHIAITNANKLVILDANLNVAATGTTTLTASTDYRISVAYTITSSSVNVTTVYLNGVSEMVATNAASNTNSTRVAFAIDWDNTIGANVSIYYAHIFIDNGTTGDIGNIKVTAKRPFANGTTNNFTGTGTPSSYGTGNARYVNERPLSTSNFVSVVSGGVAKTEEYTIEGLSVGDNDLTGGTIVDYTGWLFAKALVSETGKIIVNNVQTNISLTSSQSLFTNIAGSTTYPAGSGTDIGILTATTSTTITLYEAGIVVAYIPGVAPSVTLSAPLMSMMGVGA
jgi:hypothetical protein